MYGAISRQQRFLQNAHILVQSDNRTLVAYIRNEGGTRSLALLELTIKLLELTERLNVMLSAAYLPGRYNGIADRLSRNRPVPEWHLLPPASEVVFRIWGVPDVDLFASRETAVVDRYVTWDSRDGSAIFYDAFSRPWNFLGVSTTQPNSTCTAATQYSDRDLYSDSAALDSVFLANRSEGTSTGRTSTDREPAQQPDRSNNRQEPSPSREATASSMKDWGGGAIK